MPCSSNQGGRSFPSYREPMVPAMRRWASRVSALAWISRRHNPSSRRRAMAGRLTPKSGVRHHLSFHAGGFRRVARVWTAQTQWFPCGGRWRHHSPPPVRRELRGEIAAQRPLRSAQMRSAARHPPSSSGRSAMACRRESEMASSATKNPSISVSRPCPAVDISVRISE